MPTVVQTEAPTAVLTEVQTEAPTAVLTEVATVVQAEALAVVPMVGLTAVPTAEPMGEPQNGASRF